MDENCIFDHGFFCVFNMLIMKIIKSFFENSFLFWQISRIVFAILASISVLSILSIGGLRPNELLVNLISLVEVILLLVISLQEIFTKSSNKLIRLIAGIILAVSGIIIFVVLLSVSKGSRSPFYFLGFPFAVWMFLIGIFDSFNIQKTVE